ncbi:MAG TPA: 30S ribosomal protein S3 [Dehalococcoidia bacterium]|nr:30S ribosomal protein S3 [Dehalococcoidia bacterium]
MGQKVHPIGFRLGVIYTWQSKWFARKDYKDLLHEDLAIRRSILQARRDTGIAKIEIDRNANLVTVTIHTARPGIVIGRGGSGVEETRARLERLTGKRVRINIQDIRMPEIDAVLVAKSIAEQIEKRVSHRRAMKQAITRAMQRGALGIKVKVSGRLGGREMSRQETDMEGRVPLHTLRADIDYGLAEAHTPLGRIGAKVWIYKGDILPEVREAPEQQEESHAPAEAGQVS